MTTMTVSQARAALPELLDRVGAGEEVTITRHGWPAAVLVRPDALAVRRAKATFDGADKVAVLLEAGRSKPLYASVEIGRAETLAAAVREDRDRS